MTADRAPKEDLQTHVPLPKTRADNRPATTLPRRHGLDTRGKLRKLGAGDGAGGKGAWS